jgi:GntR family transcriptional regulator / MocR family aminotransferase
MTFRFRAATLLTLPLNPRANAPLFRQLYEALQQNILNGTLRPGVRLPGTRDLAEELDVSRNTVMNAYEQLLAEGYLEGKVGSGTYVTRTLPEDMIQVHQSPNRIRPPLSRRRPLSRRGEVLVGNGRLAARSAFMPCPFRAGIPALDAFPFDTWMRLVSRHYRRPPRDLLSYADPAGYAPLRRAIAAHLGPARAVHCDAEQVLVLTSLQQGLDLIARVLLDPGDTAWMEDPGYPSARAAFQGAAVRLEPVPVDAEGLDVAAGSARCPNARLVYVTPSHQYPLGVTMSLSRRLALLDWARKAKAWVVEDDYDSEFRFSGRPISALQGLDRDGCVIYTGTFSKTLFPSLRLAYLVVPADLVEAFVAARTLVDRQTATLPQAVVADFLNEGHFIRHIRRMRTLYGARQEALVRAAKRELGGQLEVCPGETGLHVMGWLEQGHDDEEVSRVAGAANVEARPLSSYCVERHERGGLMLGFGAYDSRQIHDGMRRLASALRSNNRLHRG